MRPWFIQMSPLFKAILRYYRKADFTFIFSGLIKTVDKLHKYFDISTSNWSSTHSNSSTTLDAMNFRKRDIFLAHPVYRGCYLFGLTDTYIYNQSFS